jgi:hypothetical protein
MKVVAPDNQPNWATLGEPVAKCRRNAYGVRSCSVADGADGALPTWHFSWRNSSQTDLTLLSVAVCRFPLRRGPHRPGLAPMSAAASAHPCRDGRACCARQLECPSQVSCLLVRCITRQLVQDIIGEGWGGGAAVGPGHWHRVCTDGGLVYMVGRRGELVRWQVGGGR